MWECMLLTKRVFLPTLKKKGGGASPTLQVKGGAIRIAHSLEVPVQEETGVTLLRGMFALD